MKRPNAFILVFVMFSFVSPCVFSIPLEFLVSSSRADILRGRTHNELTGETIVEVQLRNPSPVLLPHDPEVFQFVTETRNKLNPNMMVEALYLYKKPEPFHTSAASWDEEQRTGIFNQILAISTLTGIQYFSASRNTMRTFYEFSGVIDGPQTRNPLPDPVFANLPETLSLYARQRDLTFGDNIYRYDFVNTGDAVFFVQENITALSYGIIPAIGRGSLRSVMAIIDCGDAILIYAVSMARAASLPGMGERISNSFNNRMNAVLKWFTGMLDNTLFQ